MKYRVASQEYIDNLKPDDNVWILVENDCKFARRGKFVKRTPTGRLSIKYKDHKDWLNSNGKRTIPDRWYFSHYTLIEVQENEEKTNENN
jgi:hypothetical protein